MSEEVKEILEKAAEEFPPALKQSELEGQVFMLNGYRLVTTQFGERRVASVRLNGVDESIDAWLGGALVDRQMKALSEHEAMPCLLKLGRKAEIEGNPYILLYPSKEEAAAWEGQPSKPQAAPDQRAMPEPVSILTLYLKAEEKVGVQALEALMAEGLGDLLQVAENGTVLEAKGITLSQRAKAIRVLKGQLGG